MGKFLQVAVVDILEGVPQHMDHASLDLGLRIDSADRFFKTSQPIDTKEQNIL